MVIQFFPDWIDELTGVSHALVEQLDSNPSKNHEEFARLLSGADEEEDVGLWDVLWSDEGGVGKALVYAFTLLFGKARLASDVAGLPSAACRSGVAIAVSPGFLAMFALNATRGVAIKFILPCLVYCSGHSGGPWQTS